MTTGQVIDLLRQWAAGTQSVQQSYLTLVSYLMTEVLAASQSDEWPDRHPPFELNDAIRYAIDYMARMKTELNANRGIKQGYENALGQLRTWIESNGYGPCDDGFIVLRTIQVLEEQKRQIDTLT